MVEYPLQINSISPIKSLIPSFFKLHQSKKFIFFIKKPQKQRKTTKKTMKNNKNNEKKSNLHFFCYEFEVFMLF